MMGDAEEDTTLKRGGVKKKRLLTKKHKSNIKSAGTIDKNKFSIFGEVQTDKKKVVGNAVDEDDEDVLLQEWVNLRKNKQKLKSSTKSASVEMPPRPPTPPVEEPPVEEPPVEEPEVTTPEPVIEPVLEEKETAKTNNKLDLLERQRRKTEERKLKLQRTMFKKKERERPKINPNALDLKKFNIFGGATESFTSGKSSKAGSVADSAELSDAEQEVERESIGTDSSSNNSSLHESLSKLGQQPSMAGVNKWIIDSAYQKQEKQEEARINTSPIENHQNRPNVGKSRPVKRKSKKSPGSLNLLKFAKFNQSAEISKSMEDLSPISRKRTTSEGSMSSNQNGGSNRSSLDETLELEENIPEDAATSTGVQDSSMMSRSNEEEISSSSSSSVRRQRITRQRINSYGFKDENISSSVSNEDGNKEQNKSINSVKKQSKPNQVESKYMASTKVEKEEKEKQGYEILEDMEGVMGEMESTEEDNKHEETTNDGYRNQENEKSFSSDMNLLANEVSIDSIENIVDSSGSSNTSTQRLSQSEVCSQYDHENDLESTTVDDPSVADNRSLIQGDLKSMDSCADNNQNMFETMCSTPFQTSYDSVIQNENQTDKQIKDEKMSPSPADHQSLDINKNYVSENKNRMVASLFGTITDSKNDKIKSIKHQKLEEDVCISSTYQESRDVNKNDVSDGVKVRDKENIHQSLIDENNKMTDDNKHCNISEDVDQLKNKHNDKKVASDDSSDNQKRIKSSRINDAEVLPMPNTVDESMIKKGTTNASQNKAVHPMIEANEQQERVKSSTTNENIKIDTTQPNITNQIDNTHAINDYSKHWTLLAAGESILQSDSKQQRHNTVVLVNLQHAEMLQEDYNNTWVLVARGKEKQNDTKQWVSIAQGSDVKTKIKNVSRFQRLSSICEELSENKNVKIKESSLFYQTNDRKVWDAKNLPIEKKDILNTKHEFRIYDLLSLTFQQLTKVDYTSKYVGSGCNKNVFDVSFSIQNVSKEMKKRQQHFESLLFNL